MTELELRTQIEELRRETLTDSISPERVANIMAATLDLLDRRKEPIPSFDLNQSSTHRVAYVVGEKVLTDNYLILRFRNAAPELTGRYQLEIYRYVNKGRKRYQRRFVIPLSELTEYSLPKGEYGAIVLNISLMRIFWEVWDAQARENGYPTFHNGGNLQYDANQVAASWLSWDNITEEQDIIKFNGRNSYRPGDIKGDVLISGKFGIRLYDNLTDTAGDMRCFSIRLIDIGLKDGIIIDEKNYNSIRGFSVK